jgi:type IV pilus assembly protein PilQ
MKRSFASIVPGVLALLATLGLAVPVQAQDQPPQRVIRTYIPPDQLVSFLPSTPFDRFVEFMNPIFLRVTGKEIVDPETRTEAIGISISGMHFLDAFEVVLDYKGLRYRETEKHFLIEVVPPNAPGVVDSDAARVDGAGATVSGGATQIALPATIGSREIEINAILFELNHTRLRELGVDWAPIVGQQQQQGGQGGGGGDFGGGEQANRQGIRLFLKTEDFFDNLGELLQGPSVIDFAQLNRLFRLVETYGAGQTIAQPHLTVQSEKKGRIQIGSDVPVQTRDFSGNTITQFFSTGIIIDVTPTLVETPVADTADAPVAPFIHLDVKVEKSGSRPSTAGLIIDRTQANTQSLLLDGEQTIIGGLYSTEEAFSTGGIPLLRSLPLLKYIFGKRVKTVNQKELLIVLQARLKEPLDFRMAQPFEDDLLNTNRQMIQDALRRFNEQVSREMPKPTEYTDEEGSRDRN